MATKTGITIESCYVPFQSLISNVVSRHEGARRCWLEKEQVLEKQLEEVTGEKEELANERKTLSSQLEEGKSTLETQKSVSNEQSTKVGEVWDCIYFWEFFCFCTTA